MSDAWFQHDGSPDPLHQSTLGRRLLRAGPRKELTTTGGVLAVAAGTPPLHRHQPEAGEECRLLAPMEPRYGFAMGTRICRPWTIGTVMTGRPRGCRSQEHPGCS